MQGAKYINPYTDFGFKKLFGTPLNKDLLISFLNSLFEGKEVINDLRYLKGENPGNNYGDRRAIFDVYSLLVSCSTLNQNAYSSLKEVCIDFSSCLT